MKAYQITPVPSREEPVSDFSSSSTPGRSWTGLWVAVIGVIVCLVLAAILASVLGLGWWAYAGIQDDNATATAQAEIVLPPPGWLVMIDEEFTSIRDYWEVGPMEIDYGNVDLAIQDKHYQWQLEANSEDGISWWEYPILDHRLGNFYVSTDCRMVSGDISGTDYGLAFRILNGDNYYKFSVSDDQYMSVVLIKKGEWIDLLAWESTDLVQPGEINQVAVVAKGTHYTFFINGRFAYEMDDDQLSGGGVGMIAAVWGKSEAEFQFDNFQVYEPEQQITMSNEHRVLIANSQ